MKIKLMTFNIQHGRNHNKKGDVIDLPLMAENVRAQDPDIFGLNEVRKGIDPDHSSGYSDQPSFFSQTLGYHSYFGDAIKIKEDCYYGNAVFSKFPMQSCEKIMIPDVIERKGLRYETRCVLKTEYEINGKKLTVLNSHFGLGHGEAENAVDTVLSLVNAIDTPIVLMGDFNKTPDHEQIKHLSSVLTDVHASLSKGINTYPSDSPDMRIDYIFARGVKVLSAETVKRVVSDHYAITAEIEI